jgi:hypothetical protein
MSNESVDKQNSSLGRRHLLAVGAGSVAAVVGGTGHAEEAAAAKVANPPAGKPILLACKPGMLPAKLEGKAVLLVERLRLAVRPGQRRVL